MMVHAAICLVIILILDLALVEASSVLNLSNFSSTAANVTLAESLNSGSALLISSDGAFSWQFYPYLYDNQNKYLLVVLNTIFTTTTVVWMANRNHPVSSNTTLLFVLPSRQLILRDFQADVGLSSTAKSNTNDIWSSPSGVYSVEMNATGNLIMRDAYNATLWQSFDHPSDVMVAGQSLRTHKSLVSSISSDDVSEGAYTLKVEAGGVVFYANLDRQQNNVPYDVTTYSFAYALSNYTGSSGGNLSAALHSSCNRTYIVYDSDGIELSLRQEGNITSECESETEGYTVHGVTFTTSWGGISGFQYLKLMPDGDVQTFLVSDSDGSVISVNKPTQGFFSTSCKLPSYCGVDSLCSSYQTCTCCYEGAQKTDPVL